MVKRYLIMIMVKTIIMRHVSPGLIFSQNHAKLEVSSCIPTIVLLFQLVTLTKRRTLQNSKRRAYGRSHITAMAARHEDWLGNTTHCKSPTRRLEINLPIIWVNRTQTLPYLKRRKHEDHWKQCIFRRQYVFGRQERGRPL